MADDNDVGHDTNTSGHDDDDDDDAADDVAKQMNNQDEDKDDKDGDVGCKIVSVMITAVMMQQISLTTSGSTKLPLALRLLR